MSESFVMKRILGVEKKKRIQRSVQIEIELYQIIKENNLSFSNTINIALEKYLKEKGYLK